MAQRRSGSTTRLVNRYIEELFNNGITYVYEGRNTPNEHQMTIKCFQLFEKRMLSEHSDTKWEQEYCSIDGIWCYKVTKS
jgi:hypothetical protein